MNLNDQVVNGVNLDFSDTTNDQWTESILSPAMATVGTRFSDEYPYPVPTSPQEVVLDQSDLAYFEHFEEVCESTGEEIDQESSILLESNDSSATTDNTQSPPAPAPAVAATPYKIYPSYDPQSDHEPSPPRYKLFYRKNDSGVPEPVIELVSSLKSSSSSSSGRVQLNLDPVVQLPDEPQVSVTTDIVTLNREDFERTSSLEPLCGSPTKKCRSEEEEQIKKAVGGQRNKKRRRQYSRKTSSEEREEAGASSRSRSSSPYRVRRGVH